MSVRGDGYICLSVMDTASLFGAEARVKSPTGAAAHWSNESPGRCQRTAVLSGRVVLYIFMDTHATLKAREAPHKAFKPYMSSLTDGLQ